MGKESHLGSVKCGLAFKNLTAFKSLTGTNCQYLNFFFHFLEVFLFVNQLRFSGARLFEDQFNGNSAWRKSEAVFEKNLFHEEAEKRKEKNSDRRFQC